MTVLAAMTAGVLLGYLAGGRLANLGNADLRYGWLLGAAALVNALNGYLPVAGDWARAQGIPLLVVSYEVIGVWAVRNISAGLPRARAPLAVGSAGAACNAAVIAANGRMPVVLPPHWVGVPQAAGGVLDAKHVVMTSHAALPWLGDIFPLAGGAVMFSFGDVLLAIGFAELVAVLMIADPAGNRRLWAHGTNRR
ncbi:DUF5317 family protein [Kitasatospora sp. NPDC085879]|uniref:DUF5317 family protein n=1 Tax=Kitasatospora sp. NPDC085879 TaxID=3154769 RepID=UPI00344884A3